MTVDVWWGDPGPVTSAHRRLLDAAEEQRAAGYRHQVDRDRFVTAAVLARLAVEERTGVPADRVRLDRTCRDCGRPHGPIRTPGSSLHLSVSHAGAAVVAAVAETPVGVDVEPVERGVDIRPIADVALTPSERAGLTRSDIHEDVLLRWTAKEAILKATGDGLRLPMTGLELGGTVPPLRVIAWDQRPDLVGRIRLLPLVGAPAHHVAALALVNGPTAPTVRVQRREPAAHPQY